jgi:hypothetical protein
VRRGTIGGLLFLLMLYVLAGLFCWHEITNHGSALYGAAIAVLAWMALIRSTRYGCASRST